jgi:hypothetical protein
MSLLQSRARTLGALAIMLLALGACGPATVAPAPTSAPTAIPAPTAPPTSYRRRIGRVMLAEVAWPAAARPLAFVCGPTALVESVASGLVDLGYRPERVRTERFGPSGEAR